ncbi:MAG: flagellar motor switch protein FliN, partial [Sneathiella sp.]
SKNVADDEELNLEDLGKTPTADQEMTIPDDAAANATSDSFDAEDDTEIARTASDLEAVFDIPVHVTAVLGKSRMRVSQLLKLGRGAVIELDRKVGEAIDIYVNNRLVARGEVVVVEDRLGVTMTEIIKADRR